MATKIQMRRDTAANWQKANPVLMEGEMGLVLDDPQLYKVGDGVHAWNDIPMHGFNGNISQTTGSNENAVMSQKIVSNLLRGEADSITDNIRNPYTYLGSFKTWTEVQAELDKLHNTGGENGTGESDDTKIGEFRVQLDGRNLLVRNWVQNWSTGVFTQTVEGSIRWNGETMEQSLQTNTYERTYNGGSGWSVWQTASSSGGNMILDWKTDAATTRKQVTQDERKAGMMISYKNASGEWINEQYVGTSFDDTSWAADTNWQKIGASAIELAQDFSTEEGSEDKAISQKAVSEEFTNQNECIDTFKSMTGIRPLSYNYGKVIESYASVGNVPSLDISDDSDYKYAQVECGEGDEFYIVRAQGKAPYCRTYVFLDAENKVLSDGGAIEKSDEIITAPVRAAILVINCRINDVVLYGTKNEIITNSIKEQLAGILTNDSIMDVVPLSNGRINNYAAVGSAPNLTVENNKSYRYALFDCSEGDMFLLLGSYNSGYYRMFAFLDASNNILSLESSNITFEQTCIKAPANAVKLAANFNWQNSALLRISQEKKYELSYDLKKDYVCQEIEASSVSAGKVLNGSGISANESLFSVYSYNIYEHSHVARVLVEIENSNGNAQYKDYAVTGITASVIIALSESSPKTGIRQLIVDVTSPKTAPVLRVSCSKSCRVYLIEEKSNGESLIRNSAQQPMGSGVDYEFLDTDYEYSAIMCFGQSLSVGTIDSDNVSFDAVEGCYMLGKVSTEGSSEDAELKPLSVDGGSTLRYPITVNLCNSLKRILNRTAFKNIKLISLPIGIGGAPISQFEPEGSAGKNLISSTFERLKSVVGSSKVNIIGTIWMQGEADGSTDVEGYYQSLVNVKEWVQNKAVEVFGQKNKPLFFTYQTGAGYPNVQSIAQLNLAKNYDDVILLNPSYIMWKSTDGAHPNVNGYRMYGEICALQFKRIFLDGYKATAVYPYAASKYKNCVYINCIVPVPPLRINPKTLFAEDTENTDSNFYGFYIKDKTTDSYISIKNIDVVGGDTIRLRTYGDITNLPLTVGFLDSGYSRNAAVCDSQEVPTQTKYIANADISVDAEDAVDIYGNSLVGKSYPTYNWLNQFTMDIN